MIKRRRHAPSSCEPRPLSCHSYMGLVNNHSSPASASSPTGLPVLGESFRSPRSHYAREDHSLMLSKKALLKMPKVPRPARTLTMFTCLKRGIRECVRATESDVETLKVTEDLTAGSSTGQARVLDLEKQVKAAERYVKRLEFHLAKIEELEDNYLLQQQLREGVRNMAKAYASSPSDRRKECLVSVKCGFKECTQNLCAIEAQLENMLGTFHCRMKGLVGFARLVPGDVFEVSVRMGTQKWKTKGRIGINTQTWDNNTHVFKTVIEDILTVKAVEVKGLGKSVTLGQKNCETKDLMSSHPQMMTVSVNTNGSIKLSILVTWNPLEGVDEKLSALDSVPRVQVTPRKQMLGYSPRCSPGYSWQESGRQRPHSAYFNGDNSSLSDASSENSSMAAASHRLSVPVFPSAFAPSPNSSHNSQHDQRPCSVAIMGPIHELSSDLPVKAQCVDAKVPGSLFGSSSFVKQEPATLEEALHGLKTTLEDYQGQYVELQRLEEQVHTLDRLLKRNASGGSGRSSSVSISIENALEAFDFLESEDYYADGYASAGASRRTSVDELDSDYKISPLSTTKTHDSGIGSLSNRLSEPPDQMLIQDCSVASSSPEPSSTGNEQADTALLWHLLYCDRLLENLGSFGPLKCKEIYSLDKLQRQATVLESLLRVAKSGSHVTSTQEVVDELTQNLEVRHFWLRSVDHTSLYMNAERFLAQLEQSYGEHIRDKYDITASRVFKVLAARILDLPSFDPEAVKPCPNVTLHQFMNYFNDGDRADMTRHLEAIAGELWVTTRLRSGDVDLVIKTVLQFRDSLPPPDCLRVVALLLITDNVEVRNAAVDYVQSMAKEPLMREKAVITLVESLEDSNPDIRCASCVALKWLQASESLDQLLYMCQTDVSHSVKKRAKEALLSFGEEGRRAYEQAQLSSHGFQGVNVRL